jgi:hypothetical protein
MYEKNRLISKEKSSKTAYRFGCGRLRRYEKTYDKCDYCRRSTKNKRISPLLTHLFVFLVRFLQSEIKVRYNALAVFDITSLKSYYGILCNDYRIFNDSLSMPDDALTLLISGDRNRISRRWLPKRYRFHH